MNTKTLSIFISLCLLSLSCKAVDPVADLKSYCNLHFSDTLYRWTAKIGSAGDSVFLLTKEGYKEARHDGLVPGWTVYLPSDDNSTFTLLAGVKTPEGIHELSELEIDPERMFIGNIAQLSKIGIVTVQIDRPRKSEPVAYIYAYTVDGNYVKRTLLTQYNPDKGNPIYDQYLADDHRTKIQLQEVNP